MSGENAPKYIAESDSTLNEHPEALIETQEKELVDGLCALREALDETRPIADITSHYYYFDANRLVGAERFGDTESIYLPPQVEQSIRAYGPLTSINVECISTINCEGASFKLEYEFQEDENSPVAKLTVKRPYGYGAESGLVDTLTISDDESEDEDDVRNLYPISHKDFNRCLASLVYCNPEITTTALDAFNWYEEDFNIRAIVMHLNADHSFGKYKYSLEDEDGSPAGTFSYDRFDGSITDLKLQRITQNDVGVDQSGNIQYYQNIIESWATPNGAPGVKFWQRNQKGKDISWNGIKATADEYQAAMDFIDQQILAVNPIGSNEIYEDTKE